MARSAFFGQHGYVPDVQNLAANINMRATFIAGGGAVRPNVVASGLRTIDLAPTIAYLLGIPEPQHSQGVVRLDLLRGGEARTLVPVIGLTDFHGQLDPTTIVMDGRNVSVGGAAQLATMFDEEAAQLPAPPFLFASGDNVGASPANSGLLRGHARHRCRECLGPGCHLLRQPRVRLRRRAAAAASGARQLPLPGRQHRR